MTFSTLQQSHRDAIADLSAVLLQIVRCSAHSDDELLSVTRYGAEERRLVDAVCAVAAGEIARRSAPDLGSTGLAQRTGHRTAQELVRVTTGSTARDTATSVRKRPPWMRMDSGSWPGNCGMGSMRPASRTGNTGKSIATTLPTG